MSHGQKSSDARSRSSDRTSNRIPAPSLGSASANATSHLAHHVRHLSTSLTRRHHHHRTNAPVLDETESGPALPDAMPPVYRLYPHQTASGQRAMENKSPSLPPISKFQPQSKPVDHSSISQNEPTLHDSQLLLDTAAPKPSIRDFQQDRHTPASHLSRPQSPATTASKSQQMTSIPSEPDFSDLEVVTPATERAEPVKYSNGRAPSRSSIRSTATNQAVNRNPSPLKPASTAPHFTSYPISEPGTPDAMNDLRSPGDRSSRDTSYSNETSATSIHTLPPLQTRGPDNGDAQDLKPLAEDDPRSFDLVEPPQEASTVGVYTLEKQADLMASNDHLNTIFSDAKLLLRFTGFLNSHRPQSIPLLIYYLDALKALRAIKYSNAIAEALEPIHGSDFTKETAKPTSNSALEQKANRAFDILVREDLPAYISFTWIQVISTTIQRRITGTLAPHLREASEGLAEVFCLSDPSRPDNPIVFASEEFARTTQYGMSYAIGRNCRFLQGPRSSQHSVRRLAEACAQGREQNEVFVNYRRDGSPFMNLLMIAPLMDSRGTVRYFIGAQVDVSGLLKGAVELPALSDLMEREERKERNGAVGRQEQDDRDEFQELSEMFNGAELDTVRRYGGRMHKEYEDSDADSIHSERRPRLMLSDPTQDVLDKQREGVHAGVPPAMKERVNGKLMGVYQNYLLIRPAPSLRILFTSPSLRVPGILQSPFLNRIGGSPRVRQDLSTALGEGRGVTAKIRWLARPDDDGEGEGRPRWIHCTPLLGHSGAVGVWMVVLVDEEGSREVITGNRRFRAAPPVSNNIGGHDWEPGVRAQEHERRALNAYDVESQRKSVLYNGGGGDVGADARSPVPTSAYARRPSNASASATITNGYALGHGYASPSSSRAPSANRRDRQGHIAAQVNRPARPENIRQDTGTSTDFSFGLK